jgi:dCMP deaminase
MRKNMERLKKADYYLEIAKATSKRSTCLKANCGSIIVKNDSILSGGYNGSVRGEVNCSDRGTCPRQNSEPQKDKHLCVACHSEANAIINVARNGSGSTIDSTIFIYFVRKDGKLNTYNKPCDECLKLVINAGIKYIVNYTEDCEKICLDYSEIIGGKITTERISRIDKVPLITAP